MADTTMVIGVIGAGAMGSGIAQVAATAGHRVVLGDMHPAAIVRARELITAALARDVTKARIDQPTADAIFARITDAGDLAMGFSAFSECGLVIEAVAEDLSVKMALFDAIEREVSLDCILATNTSSLPVTAIAGRCRHPHRVLGIHFFNPAITMPLVEIIPSLTSDPEVVTAARALVDSWKKVTVVARATRRASSSTASRGRSTARHCACSRKALPTRRRSTGRCARSVGSAWGHSS